MTEEEAKKKLLDTARAEIGYHEVGDNGTKYASQYDYDTRLYGFDMGGSPWCDYFVDWCFCQTFGFDTGTAMTYQHSGCAGASCASSALYYRQRGAFVSDPEPGDQVFFYVDGAINHTGIVESVNRNVVTTIEGNSSDQVKRNQYSRGASVIAGYGRPNWKAAENVDPGIKEDDRESKQFEDETPQFDSYLDADGEFGPLTEQTVKDFQEAFGLEADGIAGKKTWGMIFELLNGKIVRRGDIDWLVTALQALLNYLGNEY